MRVPDESMLGHKFNKLTVIEKIGSQERNGIKAIYWKCQCECGNVVEVSTANLRGNHTKSCGCLLTYDWNTRHGLCYTRINSIYRKMKQRCLSPCDKRYSSYGGRGIKICDEWLGKDGFNNFYKWAIESGYSDELTIDRIDVNGNYEPSNCRWATWKEQSRNTRKTIWITYKGETHMLKEWSEILNIPYERLRQRIGKLGWDIERAFNT